MLLSYVMLVENQYNQNLKPVQDQAIARAEKVCVKVQLKIHPNSRTVFFLCCYYVEFQRSSSVTLRFTKLF